MNASIDIGRVGAALPDGFDRLGDAAAAEGVRNMAMLAENWVSGAERFDRDGAALFAAYGDGLLVGMGGMTPQADWPVPAIRVRRFYVIPDFRGRGVGRALARRVMDAGLKQVRSLTCNARATAGAGPFWEAMGFRRFDAPTVTHIYGDYEIS